MNRIISKGLWLAVLCWFLPVWHGALAQGVFLHSNDAEVWAQDQVVEGSVEGSDATEGILFAGDDTLAFTVENGAFSVPVHLTREVTPIVACVDAGSVCSDTLRYALGYVPRPEAELYATVSGRQVTLHGRVIENPGDLPLTFTWRWDTRNPVPVTLEILSDSLASFTLPSTAPTGEYYFEWIVEAADGDAFRARTFVTATENEVVPFDIERDHAAWIDEAILYEIAPRLFADYQRGRLEHVTARIPELLELGVNTIWLQPIFPYGQAPRPSQAYDVTDYFEIWSELGTEDDLRTLVETAHAIGMKVILDFVANHSSIEHPYAQDAIAHGPRSHYYDFYMRESDGAPYSFNYRTLREGEMTFLYYFSWGDMVNWDFDNPEVERLIIEASRYWIEEFDVDGYRFDAVWAPHARDPEFTRRWRLALKRIKPEALLLAEAKAPYSQAYEDTGHPDIFQSFDVAYDWTASDDCISQWAWARKCSYSAYTDGEQRTIFNSGVTGLRTRDLRNALTNYRNGFPDDAVILRFLENNDLPRMRMNHSVEQTKMAAALLFALDGIPMLYYGQELGTIFQYPSYPPGDPLVRYDRDGMWSYYQHLIRLRRTFPAFTTRNFTEVNVGPANVTGHVYAFRRWTTDQNVFAAINMAGEAVSAELFLPVGEMGLDPGTTYYLTDLFTGESLMLTTDELEAVAVDLPAYSTRLWILADSVVAIPTSAESPDEPLPDTFVLNPSYPNPFCSGTTISFEISEPGPVRITVYDVLGRQVQTLLDQSMAAGRHEILFDGQGLAGGVYFYRVEHGGRVKSGALMRVC